MPNKLELSKIKTLAGLLVLVALLVYVGWLARDYLAQQHQSVLLATQHCQPENGNCIVAVGGQQIKLELSGDSQIVHSGSQLNAVVSLNNLTATAVQLSFQGKAMYMGENHFDLQAEAPNRFSTEVMLPVCTTGRMTWQAQVTLDNAKSVIFEFDTE